MGEVFGSLLALALILMLIEAGAQAVFKMLRAVAVLGTLSGVGAFLVGLTQRQYGLCVVGAIFFLCFNAMDKWLRPGGKKKS